VAAFGDVVPDVGAPQSELDPRESSPLDFPIPNTYRAGDDGEASQYGERVAPTTDGEGDDGDWETEAEPEEIFYNVDPALIFPASVPLPEADDDNEGDSDDDDEDDSDDSEYQESGDEEEEAEAEEEDEDDEDDSTSTPGEFSSFRHPGEPSVRAHVEVTRLIYFKQMRLRTPGLRRRPPCG
jgi:hypothetical protein